MIVRRVWIAFVSTVLSGCIALPIPNERAMSLRFMGTVLDDATGQPLSGAVVRVHAPYAPTASDHKSVESVTDEKGRFDTVVNTFSLWYVLIAGGDGFCAGRLEIGFPGYQPFLYAAEEVGAAGRNGVCNSVRPIELEVRLRHAG